MLETGPLLAELLTAHRHEAESLAHGALATYARLLIELDEELGHPIVFPADRAAERLAGAALVLGDEALRVWDRHSRLDGLDVLIVTVVDVSGAAVSTAVAAARRLGAKQIHACGIAVVGDVGIDGDLDLVCRLRPAPTPELAIVG